MHGIIEYFGTYYNNEFISSFLSKLFYNQFNSSFFDFFVQFNGYSRHLWSVFLQFFRSYREVAIFGVSTFTVTRSFSPSISIQLSSVNVHLPNVIRADSYNRGVLQSKLSSTIRETFFLNDCM